MDEETRYEWLPYDKVLRYNRYVVNPSGDAVNYDFNGILHLALAALDNLRDHSIEGDFDDIGCSFTDTQRQFFLRVARALEEFSPNEEG